MQFNSRIIITVNTCIIDDKFDHENGITTTTVSKVSLYECYFKHEYNRVINGLQRMPGCGAALGGNRRLRWRPVTQLGPNDSEHLWSGSAGSAAGRGMGRGCWRLKWRLRPWNLAHWADLEWDTALSIRDEDGTNLRVKTSLEEVGNGVIILCSPSFPSGASIWEYLRTYRSSILNSFNSRIGFCCFCFGIERDNIVLLSNIHQGCRGTTRNSDSNKRGKTAGTGCIIKGVLLHWLTQGQIISQFIMQLAN